MAQFNLLTESFIQNTVPSSGSPRAINAGELEALISPSGTSVVFSGSTVSLVVDLGAQKSVDSLSYTFTPLSLSGVTVQYGRELNNLTTGAAVLTGSALTVEPTASGFTYPRYFTLQHYTASGSPIAMERFAVFNTDEEIEFGTSGTGFIDSVTLVGEAQGGYSDPVEVPVTNSGTIPTDIYIGVDTAFADVSVLNALEISPTSSGEFKSTDPNLSVPSAIPFEWGSFDGLTVKNDELKLIPDQIFPDLEVNSEYPTVNQGTGDSTNVTHTERAIDAQGDHVFVRIRENHSLAFIDPIRNTITLTSTPSHYSPSNDDERHNTHLAWDGNDTVYWLNGKDTQEIQMYSISTDTLSVFTTVTGFYNRVTRPAAYHDGWLYVGGARNTAGVSSDSGSEFWRVRISDQTEEKLTDMPEQPSSTNAFVVLGNYLYYEPGTNNGNFYRFDLISKNWEILEDHGVTFVTDLSADLTNNRVLLLTSDGDVYSFDTVSTSWQGILFTVDNNNQTVYGGLGVEDTLFIYCRSFGGISTRVRVLSSEVPQPNLDITTSGTWTSPILKVESEGNFNRPIFDLNLAAGAEMKFDQSIASYNFEIRGSDDSPSAENTFQDFTEELDPDEFLTGNFDENSIVVASGGTLTFSHAGNASQLTSSFLYYGLPLNTTGVMQYKFWWNPATDKLAGSDHFSAFYVVPFLDSIGLGTLPTRSTTTLRRADDDNIYLRFGQDSDSDGTFTRLQFYNGDTVSSASITASAGTFYETVLIIDWESGDYRIYFDTQLVDTGTIPQIRINLLNAQHSYEIFSASEEVSAEERFKHLSISRVGNVVVDDEVYGTPVHKDDPIYGDSGTAVWVPVTVNSPLIPKTKYMQFRVTLRSVGGPDESVIQGIDFVPVLTLSGVQPGAAQSVYLRYNFPAANSLSTNELSLKAWMRTDKL
jgi:hypothetical protein